jgi:hypothetical protein
VLLYLAAGRRPGDAILTPDVTELGLRVGDLGAVVDATTFRASRMKAIRSGSSTWAGAKWITNEVDQLLKESVKIAGTKKLSMEECEKLVVGSPRQVLLQVEEF